MSSKLADLVSELGPSAIAVSGGVDSMTLAIFCHRRLGRETISVAHAVSPAVPPPATARVRDWAEREGWDLRIFDAGEFADENYRQNPVNRCFFCKDNLYRAIAARLPRQILSGTNVDDLSDYRPGLDAARQYSVRHPYVEAGLDKAAVRALARELGLGDLAELPASPCLSSRVETLTRIDADTLSAIHQIEVFVGGRLAPRTVRCRVRQAEIVIELDTPSLDALDDKNRTTIAAAILAMLPSGLQAKPIQFSAYRTGSAFVGAVR